MKIQKLVFSNDEQGRQENFIVCVIEFGSNIFVYQRIFHHML